MLSAVTLLFRGLLALVGIAVLGLSASMAARSQDEGGLPTTVRYSSFTGAVTLITALFGILALFVQSIPPLISIAADGLVAFFVMAAGIAYSVQLKGADQICNDSDDILRAAGWSDDLISALHDVCKRLFALEGLSWASFIILLIVIGLGFFNMKRGGQKASFV